jgi:repressor LexA
MRQITERQAQILIFIENFIQENDYSPTIREIAEHFKMSDKGAYDHVIALIKKGCITCQAGKSRTIRIKAKKQGVDP